MHPVGPEPEQTYWRRRLAVIVAAVLLVALVIALIVGGTSTGSAVSAAPSPSPVTVPPPAILTPTPVPSPSVTPSATASESGLASVSPTASGSPSASASSSASAASSASKNSKGAKSARTPSAKPTKAAPVTCSPKSLRATLTGKQKLKPKQAATFALSLINGSDATCIVRVDPASFELKIYSGTDRIWSSNDCSTAVKTRSTTLKAEDAVRWSMRWDGRRSRKDCKNRPEIPRAGTYFATAQLQGAKPVQLRMILRG